MAAEALEDKQGIFAAHQIAALEQNGAILPSKPFAPDQIQPASLDLRLGRRAWRMRAVSCLAAAALTRRSRCTRCTRSTLTAGAVLETNCVYLAELAESLALPPSFPPPPTPRVRPAASTSSQGS